MAIPQEYIAELSRRTDIVELVRGFVQLKRAGRLEKGLCPFHNEKTPSFYVYPETNSFYCFGCNAAGDAITFIKLIQNLDYVEAVKYLAARAGMPMPDEDDSMAKLRGRVLAINRETAKFYVQQLNADAGREARVYLRGRALSDATIRRFGLGYAPDEFNQLRDHLKSRGFTEQELLQAGVCKQSQKGNVYDAFRNRVMFPIIDLRGNVIAFGGRRMGEQGPKYLNSSDTPVFKKSRGLFALNFARKSPNKRYLLTEGYMDVISLHQAGFDTAVATLGTALTDEQAKLLSDYADELVVCYDSDEAGQRATTRALAILKRTTLYANVLNLTGAKDPDEFLQKFGADRFEQLLSGSSNAIEYALGKIKKNFDITVPDGRAAYVNAALEVLASEAGPVERDIYAGRIAEETDVDKNAILQQLKGVLRRYARRGANERKKQMRNEGMASQVTVPYTVGGRKALGVAIAEQQLVAAILKNPSDFLPIAKEKVQPEEFIMPDMAEAYKVLLNKGQQEKTIDLAMLSGELPDNTVALLAKVLALNHDIGFSKDDVLLFIKRIKESTNSPGTVSQMSAEELQRHLQELRERKS